ncbi:MAG: Na+/H+ antiporter NhaC [Actinomycetia bacterium]|nr:Na+/H+ antiporter NhaC [Actinomycetes bacterium]
MVVPSDAQPAPKKPSLFDALVPVIFLMISLAFAIVIYGDNAIGGPVQVSLFLSAIVAGLMGYKNSHSITRMSKAAVDSIATAMGAIFILFAVGALIGTWNMSGTIATMTSWGIQVLNPNWFYLTAAIICGLIALGIGSAWTVMGTIGVALIAISEALGINSAAAAGAVISGAYFGDKMSPLSETTNLAPAISGTDLYTHIRSMMVTTIPAILIALGLFAFFGLRQDARGDIPVDTAVEAIEKYYTTGIITLIPLAAVIWLAVKRTPPTLAIITGALLGGIIAIIFQTDRVIEFAQSSRLDAEAEPVGNTLNLIEGVWDAMAIGYTVETEFPALNDLLSGGGMESMLNTIWLIMVALAFGGIMNITGFLGRLIEPLKKRAKTDRGAMVATGTTAIGINVLAADQYLAIVLTGNVYKYDFRQRGIAPQSLSRQIEDTATVTSPLIPWNSCGAYAAGVLGVETIAYFPWCFFNLINPILSFTYALLGFQIKKIPPDEQVAESPKDTDFYGVSGQDGAEVPLGDESKPEH